MEKLIEEIVEIYSLLGKRLDDLFQTIKSQEPQSQSTISLDQLKTYAMKQNELGHQQKIKAIMSQYGSCFSEIDSKYYDQIYQKIKGECENG